MEGKGKKTDNSKNKSQAQEFITVSQKDFPVSVLDPLNTCIFGKNLYQRVKTFLKSKAESITLKEKILTPNPSIEVQELRKALEVIQNGLGVSYEYGYECGSIFEFSIQHFMVENLKYFNVETSDRFLVDGSPALNLKITISQRWPTLDVPLPANTECPLDGRRQCKYCKWWYRKTAYTCANCKLYQLSNFKDEPDDPLPPAPKQCTPKENWISLGRKIRGEVIISFPDQFTEEFRNDIEDDCFFEAEKSFQTAQIDRWYWTTIGKNPVVSYINSFRDTSSYMLNLIEVAYTDPSSPLCVTVDVIQLTKVDLSNEIIRVSVDLTLYLLPNQLEKDIEFPCDSYWCTEHQLLVTFLMDPESIGNLGDPEMKALCTERDLMVPSSAGCGYFSDRGTTLVDMYKSLLRESNRLSVKPRGVRFNGSFESSSPREVSIYSETRSASYRSLRTSVTRHLSDLENLGYSPAPPVEGLTIELLDFQSQTLQWAVDQERQDSGIYRQLYAPILSTDGTETGTWFSPYLNRFTANTRPVDVRGGFICEEMGLGKTVICLALILSNPAPAIDSEDADEHWGVVCPRIYGADSDYKLNDPLFRHMFDSQAQAKEALAVCKQDADAVEQAMAIHREQPYVHNPKLSGMGREKLESLTRERKFNEYMLLPEVKARRKEVIARMNAIAQAASSHRGADADGDADSVQSDLTDDDAASDCKYDINGWPANAAALRATNLRTRGTLVICPVSLVGQWSMEAKEKLADKSVKIYEYYGANRKRSAEALQEYDIVITTYETLGKDISTYAPSTYSAVRPPLLQLNWHRIIFDESHRMGKQSLMTTAAQALCCKRRWMVTGTPFQSTVESISTQCRGIGLDMLGSETFWKAIMQDSPATSNKRKRSRAGMANPDSGGLLTNMMGTVAVNALLRRLMMRHSKAMTYQTTGVTLTNLPAKVEEQVDITLSHREMQDYKLMEEGLQESYLSLEMDGVGKHTIQIISLIKELQRACSGTTSCGGGGIIEVNDDEEVPLDAITTTAAAAAAAAAASSSEAKCSKLAWLMTTLQDIRDNRPEAKVLIFSQFASTFSRIVGPLSRHGFQFRTLTSDMTMAQRKKALYDFRDDPPTTIFLLSMRSGAVGLNLTQANHVILMDPCMNKQLEYQAVGRVHRLGQRREVKIYRLACIGTVEERILQMHSAGEVVSAEGTAGSLREDRVTLSEARYRSLLGLAPKDGAEGPKGLPDQEEGEEDLENQNLQLGWAAEADGGMEDDDDEDDDDDDEAMDEEQSQADHVAIKSEKVKGSQKAASYVKVENNSSWADDADEVFF